MTQTRTRIGLVAVLLLVHLPTLAVQPDDARPHPDIRLFFEATGPDEGQARDALEAIAEGWRDGYTAIFADILRFMEPPAPPSVPDFSDPTQPPVLDPPAREDPSTRVWRRLIGFVEDQTGQRFRHDLRRLRRWVWEQPYDPHPEYALFKGVWFGEIDPGFRAFFPPGVQATIRLDEIDWGGVRINGIPPLVNPTVLNTADADYLDDDHIVFGVVVNGEARAYPRRILAWHEMAHDRLGGVELTIVYCTLCGTVIPYDTVVDGTRIRLGTSGFLYRSNKLMFDEDTKSLWNTFEGVPVVGPLVGSDIRLRHRSVVTTTWEEWLRTHPDTTVLSLETGHTRDYAEGAAYRDYFSTDRLMFDVPIMDDRLDNKDEVVILQMQDPTGVRQPLAVAVDFLEDRPVYHFEHAGRRLVFLTSRRGANRVYDTGEVTLTELQDTGRVRDDVGGWWRVEETALVSESDPGRQLPRVTAQRAFWFGWYAQFPATRLVH